MQKYEQDKEKAAFNDTVFSYLKTVPGAVPVEGLRRYGDASAREKTGIIMGAGFNATKILAQKEMEQSHRQQNAPLQLTPEELDAYARSGQIPVRTSAKTFQPQDIPDVNQPDVDADGNPLYSTDGTMYRSGGKFKPVTAPMVQAKRMFESLKQNDAAAAAKAQQQPGFSILSPSTWFGNATSSSQQQPAAPATSNAAPSGPAPVISTVKSPQQQAIEWMQQNPNDPRVPAIKKKLGL